MFNFNSRIGCVYEKLVAAMAVEKLANSLLLKGYDVEGVFIPSDIFDCCKIHVYGEVILIAYDSVKNLWIVCGKYNDYFDTFGEVESFIEARAEEWRSR